MELVGRDPFLEFLYGGARYSLSFEDRNKYYVLSLSGGKDSTALLLKMLEVGALLHEVVCVDTGKEYPEMEQHIQKLKKLVKSEGIKFTILKAKKGFKYWLGDHIKTRGKNKGKKGYGWPDFQNRWCTSQLKMQVLDKYYKKINDEYTQPVEFIGIAFDEKERSEKNQNTKNIKDYPLIYWEMIEDDALQYCYEKGFDCSRRSDLFKYR